MYYSVRSMITSDIPDCYPRGNYWPFFHDIQI